MTFLKAAALTAVCTGIVMGAWWAADEIQHRRDWQRQEDDDE